MEAPRKLIVLLAGTLLVGLSSCDAVRTIGNNAADGEDFSSCVHKACFNGLKFTRLIESERLDEGGERVIYATWSGAIWQSHAFKNEEPKYLYFEAHFDADGSLSDISVGKPLCIFDNNHQRNCRILSANESDTSQMN